MTERISHPSGITKEPPQPKSGALPDLPEPTVYGNGRIGWPTILEYENDVGADKPLRSYFPPVGKIDGRTRPYKLIVHDLPRYDRLKSEGWLRDPRHVGTEISEAVDNRKAPGA